MQTSLLFIWYKYVGFWMLYADLWASSWQVKHAYPSSWRQIYIVLKAWFMIKVWYTWLIISSSLRMPISVIDLFWLWILEKGQFNYSSCVIGLFDWDFSYLIEVKLIRIVNRVWCWSYGIDKALKSSNVLYIKLQLWVNFSVIINWS